MNIYDNKKNTDQYISIENGLKVIKLPKSKMINLVKRIEAAHRRYTTQPILASNHFAVGRKVDITVQGYGRIKIDEIMLYEVKDGQIVLEQFFY